MKNTKLLLCVCVLTSGASLAPANVSATTLERGNFSEFRSDRRKAREERSDQQRPARESGSGGGFFDSLFRFQRRRWFDGNGYNHVNFASTDQGEAVAVQPDGKIVVVGRGNGASDFVMVRYLPSSRSAKFRVS